MQLALERAVGVRQSAPAPLLEPPAAGAAPAEVEKGGGGTEEACVQLAISGMQCHGGTRKVLQTLSGLPAVHKVVVDGASSSCSVWG